MNNLANAVLPRALLIHRQYTELSMAFAAARIPFILLKGIALIETFPELMNCRDMEDIDILVPRQNYADARAALVKVGYWPAPQDPSAHIHTSQPVAVDIIDNIWYLTEEENRQLFYTGSTMLAGGNGRILNPVEFYAHVFGHGAIHHANTDGRWRSDLKTIDINWHVLGLPELKRRLCELGWEELHDSLINDRAPHGMRARIMLRMNSPKAGHLARVLMLRRPLLFRHLRDMFFPDASFIRGRYNAGSWWQVFLWRVYRPIALCKDAVFTASRLFARQ